MNSSETVVMPASSRASVASFPIYISKERLDGATSDPANHGFDCSITIGNITFKVRNYFDAPGESTVISPLAARQSQHARRLVDYLVAIIGCQRVHFYDGWNDMYREVDLQTLEFQPLENRPEPS